MASASFNSMAVPPLQPITEKLTRSNLPVWKVLVTSALKGTHLSEFLYGKMELLAETILSDDKKMKVHNPELAIYVAKQQQVLNFLLTSLSKDMLEYVATYTTPHEVWNTLIAMATSQSRARVINTRMTLSTTRKGSLPVARYIGKMKALTDDMAFMGKKLDDEDLVSYILVGLDSDFDSVISIVVARAETDHRTQALQPADQLRTATRTSWERLFHSQCCV
jgi:hypothetical protein